jgi:outer membrane biosynthesis protein TonB
MIAGGVDITSGWQRSLFLAGLVSLALHLALIFSLYVEMPEWTSPATRVLQARLVPMKPLEPMLEPVVPVEEAPKPKPEPKRRPPRAVKPIPPAEPKKPPAAAQAPVEEPKAPESAPLPVEQPPPPVAATPAPGKKLGTTPMPRQILIRFTVNWGADGIGVAKAEYRWERNGRRYNLQSTTEPTGVIALFASQKLQQTSIGVITDTGLQPEAFVMQRGTTRTDSALFDWTEQSLQLVSSEKIETVPLPPGTQDIMSVLFQFVFDPPSGSEAKFTVVTGRKLETYSFQVIGEEMLDLGIGHVKALHLRRPKTDSDDGMDCWLDVNRLYLPVKIVSQQRRDSRPIELIAREILVPPREGAPRVAPLSAGQ